MAKKKKNIRLALVHASPLAHLCLRIQKRMLMDYKRWDRTIPVCLECGDRIRYGRTDKKFCSDDCRNKHNNGKLKESRAYRRKVLALLERNYELLDDLLKMGVDSADFANLVTLGFTPDAVTFYHRSRRHDDFACFDIKYKMSESRIYSISKIQNVYLPLQADEDKKHQ